MIPSSKIMDSITARLQESVETKPSQITSEINAIKKNKTLPFKSVEILRRWLSDNYFDAYPDEAEKKQLSELTSLTETQISNWFINARRRILPDLLIVKGIDPVQLGFYIKGNRKKTMFQQSPKSNLTASTPLQPTGVVTAVPQIMYEFSPLNLLAKVSHEILLQNMTEECSPLRYTCGHAQSSKGIVVNQPYVTETIHLEEEMSRLQILADVASQRIEEMEAEKAKMEAALNLPDQ